MNAKYSRALNLASIPDDEWRTIKESGFDLVWLMGVWTRSPKARQHALTDSNLKAAYDQLLPGWTPEDVGGSPYSIYEYHVDPFLGDDKILGQLHRKLQNLGLGLILDFVPNHLALDHSWTKSDPELFVQASKKMMKAHPERFFQSEGGIWLAHGRDPFFDPWIDTTQINFFSKATRSALTGELLRIAELCDGVRCDMAMLGLNKIFDKVWGDCVKEKCPKDEFWLDAISTVRAKREDFIFLAEVYWNLEWDLQQLGFDYTYDKKMYDRLKSGKPQDVQGHLRAEEIYQNRSARFLENHDEDRAVYCFGREKSQAAAVVIATVPGLRFFQDGQLDGKRLRTPIHLRREAPDKIDYGLVDFYRMLINDINEPVFHQGVWKLLDLNPASENNVSYQNIMAWTWESFDDWRLIVVNYSETASQARVPASAIVGKDKTVKLRDRRSGEIYRRDRDELVNPGLFVDLKPWQVHLFEPA
jgi:hypothetical protein